MAKKRGTQKRDSLKRGGRTTAFAKRGAGGKFKEIDNPKRSIPSDRRKNAKTRVPSGYGDQGDQKKKK